MLDKHARWYFPGQDVQGVVQHIGAALQGHGLYLAPSGPMRWSAEATVSGSYGLKPKLWISMMPDQGGFWLDVRLWAHMDAGTLVMFVLAWSFCFPLAILLMVLGNQSWTSRADELMQVMHYPVAHLQSTPQWGQPPLGA